MPQLSLEKYASQRRRQLRYFGGLIVCLALAFVMGPASSASSGAADRPSTILVFGDSLSAEYGLKRASGWVSLLQDRLKSDGFPHAIVNASISGETTAGGLSRLAGLLGRTQPDIFILQLGANDGLRGLPIAQTEKNLRDMIRLAESAGAKTLVVGIRIPPNYGAVYAKQFDGLFAKVSKASRLPVVPFLLEGFADRPDYFQADGIHPNERAQPLMLETVWPALKPLLLPGRPAS
jgi:acyl-CoA thioesterase-1